MSRNKPNQNKNNVPFIVHSSVIENYNQISYIQVNEHDGCLTDRLQVLASPLGGVGGVLVEIKRANMAAAPAPAPSGFTFLVSFSHPSPETNSVPSDLSVKLPRSTVMRFGLNPTDLESRRRRIPAVPSGGTPPWEDSEWILMSTQQEGGEDNGRDNHLSATLDLG